MHLQMYVDIPLEERAFWESTGLLDKLIEEAEQWKGGESEEDTWQVKGDQATMRDGGLAPLSGRQG